MKCQFLWFYISLTTNKAPCCRLTSNPYKITKVNEIMNGIRHTCAYNQPTSVCSVRATDWEAAYANWPLGLQSTA